MQINLEGSLISGIGTLLITMISALWKQNSNDRKERRERDTALYSKIDRLVEKMSHVRENFVPHSTCRRNRKDCPCHKEIENIKEGLKK